MTPIGTFDYIIVGAGSAGCVLANRLSADPSTTVLLLEAGGKDDYFWLKIPAGVFYCIGNPRLDWRYMSEPEPGFNGQRIPVPRGKTLGGSSSINGMAYIRGQARDYDLWRQQGNTGWAWDDVLPYFRKSEDYIHGADEAHGAGGLLRVEDSRMRWEVLDAIQEACTQVGIPKRYDFNRGDNEGCGYFQVTQKRGTRWSTATAFLKPAHNRPNLRVVTEALCNAIRFKGKRVAGVEFWQGSELQYADVTGEVIVCGGAIGSPQVLQLSGIGSGSLLRERGVDVVHDLPGVGENYHDHTDVRYIVKMKDADTLNTRYHNPVSRVMMGVEYALFGRGPMVNGPPPLSAFMRSDASRETPNIQFRIGTNSTDRMGAPPHRFPAVAGGVCNLRPLSRGHIRIKSADAREYPAVFHNVLAEEDDRRVAIDSIKMMHRIFDAPALARYAPEMDMPHPNRHSDDELLAHARKAGSTDFHPAGSCKMGPDAMAVVDDQLRVHGVSGLRVADASIMPAVVSGNTNAPTIMIAEKAADMIRADAKARLAV